MANGKNEDAMSQIFEFIEKSTTGFMDKLIKDDNLIKIMGKWRDNVLDFKTFFDKVITESLKNMNLPNKKDQEKTLHKINMLESMVDEISEKVQKLASTKKPAPKASKEQPAS
jgi:hypothetical protein